MSFPKLQNDNFLRALQRQSVDRTPIWLMRQAGRYLPEYRQTRAQAGDFMSLCMNPELACEVTLQPLRRFDLDAAILFSDILTIPDAMGLGLYFAEGEGPKFRKTVRNESDVAALQVVDTHAQLDYVVKAVSLIRNELGGKVPLIGFSGSPWTLATYMTEGQSTRDFKQAKSLIYNSPEVAHELLNTLALSVIDYLKAQIRAGAQAVQIFDTWGGVLTGQAYKAFSLDYMSQIVNALKADPDCASIPVILFTKGGGQWLELIAASGCDALGLDWSTDIGQAFDRVGDKVALQGNLDPAILRSNPQVIETEVERIMVPVKGKPGHIFNLGHGITPDVPPDHVTILVDHVHKQPVS